MTNTTDILHANTHTMTPLTFSFKMRILLLCIFGCMMDSHSSAQVHSQQWKHTLRQTDEAFFKTEEARRIGEQLIVLLRLLFHVKEHP